MNPQDSWLDIPPKFKTSPPTAVFPAHPNKPAAAPKAVKKAAPKKAAAPKKKNSGLPYHEG
jgi:hypothetical protein